MSILTEITDPSTSAATLAEVGTNAGHLDQVATWENRVAGTNVLDLPGISGNVASTPDAASLDGFDDFALQLDDLALPDWTPASSEALFSKYHTTGNRSWYLLIAGTTFRPSIYLSNDGAVGTLYTATAAPVLTDGDLINLRVLRVGSAIRFYLDTGSGFAQLGTDVTDTTGTLFLSSANVVVGGYNDGSGGFESELKVGRARVWNTATPDTSDPVLDIDFSRASLWDTSFVCRTGQTITINQSGADRAKIASVKPATDAAQATGNFQPRYLTPGPNGPALHLPGLNVRAAVPTGGALDISGDMELEAVVTPVTWANGVGNQTLIARRAGGLSYQFRFSSAGIPQLYWWEGAVLRSAIGTAAISLPDGEMGWVKMVMDVDNGAGAFEVRFLESADGSNWSLIGDPRVGGFTTYFDIAGTSISLGLQSTVNDPLFGKFHRAIIRDGVDGTVVLDVNFATDAKHGDLAFTASTGQTVTVQPGTGDDPAKVIGYPVIRTDGVDDVMFGAFLENQNGGYLFMVADVQDTGTWRRLFSSAKDGGIDGDLGSLSWLLTKDVSTTLGTTGSSSNFSITRLNAFSDGSRLLMEVKYDGTNGKQIVNGVELTDTGDDVIDVATYAIAGADPGGANCMAMDILYIALFPADLTELESQKVHDYLNNRFKIY